MYDVGSNLSNGIKTMYINSLASVRVKGNEGKGFKIDSGVRKGCMIFLHIFNVYMEALM